MSILTISISFQISNSHFLISFFYPIISPTPTPTTPFLITYPILFCNNFVIILYLDKFLLKKYLTKVKILALPHISPYSLPKFSLPPQNFPYPTPTRQSTYPHHSNFENFSIPFILYFRCTRINYIICYFLPFLDIFFIFYYNYFRNRRKLENEEIS